ncbi:MAG: chromosome segregation protein SMC, partial [Planctomycetes bacterium]|nr:chromosome segregation protein SMC [Planctomycetota bacterium]
GSRSRKPASMAEVSLNFDNDDGTLAIDETDVTVTRQLFRNGASDYLINGKSSRLKDIRDLFLDTGVGVDAYSMIEQGRVDVLLQANPIERRQIFEEAAGISKYKLRRAEAERKLERSRNNLLRLDDVIDEVEKRLRSVKLAAGKARNYQAYDEKLRELKSTFSLAEFHDLQQSRSRLNERQNELTGLLHAKRAELAARDVEGAELEGQLQDIDARIRTGESELADRQSELSALDERIHQNEQRRREAGEQCERLQTRSNDLAEFSIRLEKKIAEEQAGIDEHAGDVDRLTAELERLEQQNFEILAHREDAERSLDQAKQAVFEAARTESLVRNQRTHLEQHRDRLEAEVRNQENRLRALDHEHRQLSERQESLAREAEALDREAADLTAQLGAVEDDLAALQAECERLDGEIVTAREARSGVISRLSVLEDMERRLEGVNEAARTLLAWRDDGENHGVIGLIADLIRIDDPRVALLETVLSTFENHVLVEDTYALLSELSRRPSLPGPVGIYALDRITPHHAALSQRDHAGFVACARDWVRCEPRLEPLADFLLGRTVVVDTVEHALAMASGASEGCCFVTLDGDTVGSDGRLVLGGRRSVTGLITRKTEIRQLRQLLDEIETQLERHARQRSQLAERRSDADLSRQSLLERIAAAQKQHSEIQTQLARMNDAGGRIEREKSLIAGELAAVRRSLADVSRDREKLDAECAEIVRTRAAAEDRVGALDATLASTDQEAESLRESLTTARVELGRAGEKRTAAEESLEQSRVRQQSNAAEIERAQGEVQEALERIATVEQTLKAAGARQSELTSECVRRRDEIMTVREGRQQLRSRIEACGVESKSTHARIEELDGQSNQTAIELREVEVRSETMASHVLEELSIDLVRMYPDYTHEDQDWTAIKAEIDELRRKIDRLGSVNLDAIHELEELTPRHEHLTTQRADLLDSIGRLDALIEELNNESRERFTRSFEAIRGHFRDLFRKLFGGGKADIILEDEEQPLECGIEIIARPPGKEPQSISLLSGGEKTLTAVALLLAVFKCKPSPFTILDEVDAALDEANNERFNAVVQEFLAHSQFIMITHSKVTMHCADVLYGVTMQEAGVSKRVSVRFDDRVTAPSVA